MAKTDVQPAFDCQTCGACCAYYEGIDINPEDRNFAFLENNELIRRDMFGDYEMKTYKRRCIALSGEVCEQVSCSIYDNRPEVCRQYTPGGERCQVARMNIFADYNEKKETLKNERT